jgi:type II secretory pathway component PulC
MKNHQFLSAAVLCVAAPVAVVTEPAPDITNVGLRRHVEYLASDALMGRETGDTGCVLAEEYIAAEFERAGLAPLPGHDHFFIDYDLYRLGFDPDGTSLQIESSGATLAGRPGRDFRPFPFSDDGEIEAEVVFAGYGITAPDLEYDDYAGLDVDGKFVLVLRHEPGERDSLSGFDGTENTNHALFATKASNAQDHGAVGMILVTDPLNHESDGALNLGGQLRLEPPDAKGSTAEDTTSAVEEQPFLAIHVSRRTAERMVATTGNALIDLQRALDAGTASAAGSPLRQVRARVRVARRESPETVRARNVVGYLEGRDPDLTNELIVVGAHHDHIGGYDGEGDTIYNGADDNASGTAGVLELAKALGGRGERPRRSILFTTFSGEEHGLLGSRAMVERELVPLERVVFMLNMDMIGRNPGEPLRIIGDGLSRGLAEVVQRANREVGLDLEYGGKRFVGNSDHAPFYDRDIPFIHVFSGVHDDYHQLSDHADKLAYERMEKIVSLTHRIVADIAEADRAPGIIYHVTWLGVEVEVLDDGGRRAATVTAVEKGSRGETAGFAVGDELLTFGGEALADPDDVGPGFRAIKPGTDTEIGLRRDVASHTLTVRRARTGYLGVRPGSVDDETRRSLGLGQDDGVLIRQVIGGGPSDSAGVRTGDILISIAGQPIGSGNLRSRLQQIGAGEEVELVVIREGRRTALPVRLGERPRR